MFSHGSGFQAYVEVDDPEPPVPSVPVVSVVVVSVDVDDEEDVPSELVAGGVWLVSSLMTGPFAGVTVSSE